MNEDDGTKAVENGGCTNKKRRKFDSREEVEGDDGTGKKRPRTKVEKCAQCRNARKKVRIWIGGSTDQG